MTRLTFLVGIEFNGRQPYHANAERTNNMGWIEEYLKGRADKEAERSRQHDLQKIAELAIPSMFSKLRDQVKHDVSRYAGTTGIQIDFNEGPGKHAFNIKAPRFPTFWLAISAGRDGLHRQETRKKSSTSAEQRQESLIPIIAKGQDEFYYRFEDGDVASEDEASGRILRSLLQFVDE